MASPRHAASMDGWLSLGPASRLVGVDPDTLRRWADSGRVEAFVTPGGHRRFNRRALERMVREATPERASLARLGATPERLNAAYRRRYVPGGDGRAARAAARSRTRGAPAGAPTPDPLDVVSLADRETFRLEGRQLIEALLRYLDARDAEAARDALDDASGLVDALGTRLARSDVGLTDAVALFVAARRPFLAELAAVGRRRALDPAQLGELFERASSALDGLLVVLVQSHRAAA
jgi:excisionase family DNA binding protein